MAEDKKVIKKTENPEQILAKVRKLRPAGSVKELIELANKELKSGKFVYNSSSGNIEYKK